MLPLIPMSWLLIVDKIDIWRQICLIMWSGRIFTIVHDLQDRDWILFSYYCSVVLRILRGRGCWLQDASLLSVWWHGDHKQTFMLSLWQGEVFLVTWKSQKLFVGAAKTPWKMLQPTFFTSLVLSLCLFGSGQHCCADGINFRTDEDSDLTNHSGISYLPKNDNRWILNECDFGRHIQLSGAASRIGRLQNRD